MTDGAHSLVLIAAMAAIFALDVMIPRGLVISMLYAAPVLLALWSPAPKALGIAIVAAVCTVLTALGMVFSHEDGALSITSMPFANRVLALAVIWITALLAILRLRTEEDFPGPDEHREKQPPRNDQRTS